MKCHKCGADLLPEDKFCINCGAKVEEKNTQSSSDEYRMPESGYTNVSQTTDSVGSGIEDNSVNLMVRRYFLGFSDIKSLVVCIYFVLLIFALRMGFTRVMSGEIVMISDDEFNQALFGPSIFVTVIFLIAELVVFAYDINYRKLGQGRGYVDNATLSAVKKLKARAFEKLNVDSSQISEIEPIVVAGIGNSPKCTLDSKKEIKRFILKIIFWYIFIPFMLIKNCILGTLKIRSKEPLEGVVVDSDKVQRYLLVQVTVYAFSDTRLLIYTGNIDIATGLIYEEEVTDIFYKDINSVTSREFLEVFRAGFLWKKYYIMTCIDLDVCGIRNIAAFDTRLGKMESSDINRSIEGMKSYIRDKKRS